MLDQLQALTWRKLDLEDGGSAFEYRWRSDLYLWLMAGGSELARAGQSRMGAACARNLTCLHLAALEKDEEGFTAGQQLGDLDSSSCLLPVHIEEGLLILPALQDHDQRRGIGCGHPLSAC